MSAPSLPLPPQPTLRTPRLVLAPLTPADADDVFAYARDPRVLQHVNAPTPERVEETRAWVEAASREPTAYHWAARLAEGGVKDAVGGGADNQSPVVGVLEFDALSPGLGAVHYALAARCWGWGLATEALGAILDWTFAHVPGLATVETTVAQANPGSARVLEKCGFRRVGEDLAPWAKAAAPVPTWRYRRDAPARRMCPAAERPCLFCEIVAGREAAHVVWSDADHVAFLDVHPMRPGHLLLVPSAHAATVYDLAPAAFAALFDRVRRLGPLLARATGADRAALAVEGYGVAHAHVHLVPVTAGGQLDPCRQAPANPDMLAEAAGVIRNFLAAERP